MAPGNLRKRGRDLWSPLSILLKEKGKTSLFLGEDRKFQEKDVTSLLPCSTFTERQKEGEKNGKKKE